MWSEMKKILNEDILLRLSLDLLLNLFLDFIIYTLE